MIITPLAVKLMYWSRSGSGARYWPGHRSRSRSESRSESGSWHRSWSRSVSGSKGSSKC